METESRPKKRKFEEVRMKSSSENSAVFKRRKEGIMKKASQLSTLCGIPVCIVIQSPINGEFDVWPRNLDLARSIIQKYYNKQQGTEIAPAKTGEDEIPKCKKRCIRAEVVVVSEKVLPFSDGDKGSNGFCGEESFADENTGKIDLIAEEIGTVSNGLSCSQKRVSICSTEKEIGTDETLDDHDLQLADLFFPEKGFAENPGESLFAENLELFAFDDQDLTNQFFSEMGFAEDLRKATGLITCSEKRASSLCSTEQQENGIERTNDHHDLLVNQFSREKGRAENPDESLCSPNESVAKRDNKSKSIDDDDSCSFLDEFDLPPLDPNFNFEYAGCSSSSYSHTDGGLSALDDPCRLSYHESYYSNWESFWHFEGSALWV